MKKFLLSIFCCLMAFVGIKADDATLSFANKAQRTSFSTTQQVWSQNGITFTNDKSASTTNVADYANPARLYAGSKVLVECSSGNITKIVFDCNSSSYATALKNSIGTTATTSVSSDKVTVTLDGTTNSFTIAKLTAQVRIDALTVTYVAAGGGTGVPKPITPTLTAGGNFVGSKKVEISCATEGAEIYYTTDGTEPTKESEAYVEAFDVTETTTVKAIAVNEAGASSVATATYTRVAATPEISFGDKATFEESVEVTIVAADGTTAYYTLNGKTPTENSDEYTKPLTIKADVTLQVIAYDEDGIASPVVKQAFKKASSGSTGGESTGKATLVEDVDDLTIGDNVVIVAAGYNYALSTTQNSNNRGQVAITKSGNDVELNDNVQILTLEAGTVDGTFAFNTGSGFLYAASSSSNHLKTQATNNENGSWKIEIAEGKATIQAQGKNARNLLKYNQTSSLFSCYGSGQEDVSIYKVNISTVEDYILDVTEAGWATMYLGYNVIIPTGVKCYVIPAEEGKAVISETGKICLEEITEVIPANTGVIVKAEEGEYAFVVAEEGNDVVSVMAGTTKNEYIDKEAYVLGIVDGEVGLYKAAMNGGVWLNNANKAYLPVSAIPDSAQGAANYSFSFDWNGTTGIDNIEIKNPMAEGAIYDLTGRKINKIAVSGIYIINGKKVFVRK